MSARSKTQLVSANGYSVKDMKFCEPKKDSGESKNRRIPIVTKYRDEDGNEVGEGDLVIPTSELFSFGPKVNVHKDTGVANGYVMPICLFNRDGPSDEEMDFFNTFNAIVQKCIDYMLSNKEKLGLDDELDERDFRKFNPLWYKKDEKTKKPVEGATPTLYAKLISSKKNGILTKFYDMDADEEKRLDPMEFLETHCDTIAAIKFESIYIGQKISLQVKLYEASVRVRDSGVPRLLKKRPTSILSQKPGKAVSRADSDDEKSDAGSVVNDDVNDDEETKSKTPPKKPVKFVKRKVAKSKVVAKDDAEE